MQTQSAIGSSCENTSAAGTSLMAFSSIMISWWSVLYVCGDAARPLQLVQVLVVLKPTVKVRTGRSISRDITATLVEESMPPERSTPNGHVRHQPLLDRGLEQLAHAPDRVVAQRGAGEPPQLRGVLPRPGSASQYVSAFIVPSGSTNARRPAGIL